MMQETYRIDDEAFLLMIYGEKSVRVTGLAVWCPTQIPWLVSDTSSTSDSHFHLRKSVYDNS